MERNLKNLSYEEIKESCKKIAQKIKEKGLKIDIILPLLKGGMNIGALIANELDLDDFAFIQTKSAESSAANAKLNEPVIVGSINLENIKDKNVLICDDIFDTDRSLELVEKEIKKYSPKNIYSAVSIIVNPKAREKENFIYDLDYCQEHYWIVFPWEK